MVADVDLGRRVRPDGGATVERHGRLDVLVTAAESGSRATSAEMTEAQWDRTIDVNLKGTFFACRSSIPALAQSEGSIVAHLQRLRPRRRSRRRDLQRFEVRRERPRRSLGSRAGAAGVRVNSVCPADVDTPMLAGQARDFGGRRRGGLPRRLDGHPAPGSTSPVHPPRRDRGGGGVPRLRRGGAHHRARACPWNSDSPPDTEARSDPLDPYGRRGRRC